MLTVRNIKSSLSKSMQPAIPPTAFVIFCTSQVDLTHSDDYHYCIEVLLMFTIVFTSITNDNHHCV